MIHLHLDPVGGLAGDMFAAALLSAFPEHADAVRDAARRASGTECRLRPHADAVLAGHRFVVLGPDGAPADAAPFAREPEAQPHHGHGHGHEHEHHHDHAGAGEEAHAVGHAHPAVGLHTHDHGHEHGHHHAGAGDEAHAAGHAHPAGSLHTHDHDHDHDHGYEHGHHHAGAGDEAHAAGHDHPAVGLHAHADHAHDRPAEAAHAHRHDVHQDHHHAHHHHGHRAWREIRDHLRGCGLPDAVRDHAIGIFSVLAEAEGAVHGRPADAVTFHEVGNADSIADIVAAAVLIDRIGAAGWSVSALPLGGGRVRTAHGAMPVPAPATTLLLRDLPVMDDGVGGERVTPTGAAILCYLSRAGLLRPRPAGHLGRTGIGFGTRRLPGLSNCVRVFAIDADAAGEADTPHRTLSVVSFEIDDQSGEDLAAGLDRIRAIPGVHDVIQMMAVGKKGRIATHVQVLSAPDVLACVTEACFSETTTIGLRTHAVQGRALRRRMVDTRVDGAPVTVKLVQRPHGETGKAESDHVLDLASHDARDVRRRRAVRNVLGGSGQ